MNNLPNLKIIIDIGAKETTFPEQYPEAQCHLFEPSPEYAKKLKEKYANWDVVINEFGISDCFKEGTYPYSISNDSFVLGGTPGPELPLKSLDKYIKDNAIEYIDLLKVDTEGMDLEILKGNPKAVGMSHYIIFEVWDNLLDFYRLLGEKFFIVDIGQRNYLCKRK